MDVRGEIKQDRTQFCGERMTTSPADNTVLKVILMKNKRLLHLVMTSMSLFLFGAILLRPAGSSPDLV